MTYQEALRILDQIAQNMTSSTELRRLKEAILNLEREAKARYIAENFSIEELREMGFDI